jgi:hypothetical protein
MQLPPQKDEMGEDIHMDPQVEAQLSPMLAQAAQQLLQQNQAQAAQQAAQQAQQDPMVQMQQQELQLKMGELERKKQKDLTDAALKEQQIKNDMLKTAVSISTQKEQHKIDKGVEVLKQLSSQNHEHRQLQNKPTKGE